MLVNLLKNKKSQLVQEWIQSIIETYPVVTSKFFGQQKNRFSNPVGFTITQCAEKLFDKIVDDKNIEDIKVTLVDLIKIRAVQNFSPSEAVGFIFSLKKILCEMFEKEIIDNNSLKEIINIESKIDSAALAAFDLYMESREKVFEIKVNEIKARLSRDNKHGIIE